MNPLTASLSVVRTVGELLSGVRCKGKSATIINDAQNLLEILENILTVCTTSEMGGDSNG